MVMQRPLGSTTAFSIDSLIGGPPQPSPGHFVYTGYPMFMPYRSVVLQPPPPPPPALQQALPAGHHPHPQIPGLQSGFCSSLAQGLTQGMALTSTLMASLPGGFSPSQQHQDAARKFGSAQALHAVFDKAQELRLEAEDGKGFLPGKDAALQGFHDADTAVQTATGRRLPQPPEPGFREEGQGERTGDSGGSGFISLLHVLVEMFYLSQSVSEHFCSCFKEKWKQTRDTSNQFKDSKVTFEFLMFVYFPASV